MSKKRIVPEEYRTFDHTHRGHVGRWIFFLFIILIVLAAGYYYWNQRSPYFSGQSATLDVTATDRVVSGDTASYTLHYRNNDQVPLTRVEVDVQWPEGFYYDTSSLPPTDNFATTWQLPDIDPGQSADLTIQGQLVGDKDFKADTVFRLNYQPKNFSSNFSVKQAVSTVISDTKLAVELRSPDKALAGQDLSLTAAIKNITPDVLKNIQTDFTLPPDLTVTKTEPALTNNSWLGDLAAGQEILVTITGTVSADATRPQNWLIELGQKNEDKLLRLQKARKDIVLINPQIQTSLKVNGRDKDFEAEWGQQLDYDLTITNNSSVDIGDLSVQVLMDGQIADLNTFTGDGRLDGNKVVWDQDQNIQAGQSINHRWSIKIQTASQAGRSSIDNVAQVSIKGLNDWKSTSPLLVVSVGEGLSFSQGAYWQLASKQVGSGELPPRVGKNTNYIIIWSLDNGTTNYNSVTLSAILPPNVTYVGKDSLEEGEITYDADSKKLTWQLDNFPTLLLPLQASFEIKLTPTKEDVGQVVALVNPVTVTASGDKDFQTKSSVLRSSQVINSAQGDWGTVVGK